MRVALAQLVGGVAERQQRDETAGEEQRANKFWPAVARIDNAYGDRNLVCTCPSVEELASTSADTAQTLTSAVTVAVVAQVAA